MSLDHTRKHFLGKLMGLMAAVGLAPKLLAKPADSNSADSASKSPAILVRPDARAVARAADSV